MKVALKRKMVTNAFLMKMARQTMVKLGVGHTESVYQYALVTLLMSAGVPSMTEVNIPYFVNGICVGMGRADILLNSHLIELKANQKSTCKTSAQAQLAKYLRSMSLQGATPRNGLLILFNTPNHGPIQNRVSFVELSHREAMNFVPNNTKGVPVHPKKPKEKNKPQALKG